MSFLKKHKGKITAFVVIAVLLVVSYMWGGNVPENNTENKLEMQGEISAKSDALISSPETQILPDYKSNDLQPDAQGETPQETVEEEPYLDKYKTEPTPVGHPAPIEPQTVTISDKELTCTLSVRCDSILDNIELLDGEKTELVPSDGIILEEQQVTFYEGESVFNVLLREMKRNGIHFEYVNTPIYNSAYIEGINNLYEFDCGELSGWMYKVNGWFPSYGCSRYRLKDGDKIEWVYTCDLGKDISGNNIN